MAESKKMKVDGKEYEDTVFKSVELHSKEHQIFDLTHRWRGLIDDTYDFNFDEKYFITLFKDTVQFFHEFCEKNEIPKDTLGLILVAHEFMLMPIDPTHDVENASIIVDSLLIQLNKGWVITDGQNEDLFTVIMPNEELKQISISKFKLSDIDEEDE